jgi:hypothetical protein
LRLRLQSLFIISEFLKSQLLQPIEIELSNCQNYKTLVILIQLDEVLSQSVLGPDINFPKKNYKKEKINLAIQFKLNQLFVC